MMTKPVVIGVMLFVAGLAVGRASVLMTQPEAPTAASPHASGAPTGPVMGSAAPALPEPQHLRSLRGKVAEVLQVPQYTYIRFESGEWAAVPSETSLRPGQEVEVLVQTEMQNFSSPSLGRTFERVSFASLPGGGGSQHADLPATGGALPPNHPPASGAPTAGPEVKAALQAAGQGGPALQLRVTDVYSERAMLAGKRVKVKGTIDRVMVVQGISYVHLKDGTGAAADKTDDLLCLSSAPFEKGAQVTLEGVVALNKDVGMGPLPVVLDDAQPAR